MKHRKNSDQGERSIAAEEDSDFEVEVVTNVTQINNLVGAEDSSTEEDSNPEDWKLEEDSRIQECYDDMSLLGEATLVSMRPETRASF